tara:strand:+ start:460 stop:576 length:117 start_codon:yes stop_codon:yes gene_type:complete
MNSSLPIRLTGSVQIIKKKDLWQLFNHQQKIAQASIDL